MSEKLRTGKRGLQSQWRGTLMGRHSFPSPTPLKLGGFLVFEIWTKRGVMKKLLRDRGVS